MRRISPSVTTSRPASSCTRTAASTARSSMALKAAGVSAPEASCSRAWSSSAGRSKLPTTSVCTEIIALPARILLRSRPLGEAPAATIEPRAGSSGRLLRACAERAPPSLGRDLAEALVTLLRLRGGFRWRLESGPECGVGQYDEVVHDRCDDDKRDHGVDHVAVLERALVDGKGQIAEVRSREKGSDERGEQVLDERLHHRAEGRANDDANCQVDHVAPQQECPESGHDRSSFSPSLRTSAPGRRRVLECQVEEF